MAKNSTGRIRLSAKDRLNVYSGLSTMMTAGIPILEAVESLLSDAKGNSRKVLDLIRASLYNGEPLSRVLEKMPKAFDPVSVNLIRSAEAGGTLDTTLRDIVVSTKKEMTFSEQLRVTMIYPLFVMIIFLGIVVLMLTFVIPRVASVFTNMNVKIPLVTRIMMKASTFFLANWFAVLIVFVATIVIAIFIIRSNKRLMIRLILSLPMLRTLGTNIDLARFCRSFGLLMNAGVPIVEALDLSERVVIKSEIIKVIKQVKIDVSSGKPLAEGMRKPKSIIPPIMSRSIKTAESSGALDQTLQNLTEYFDEQVSDSLKVLGSLIEPVLIMMVGTMVGALMISIIAPIYGMISQISVIPSSMAWAKLRKNNESGFTVIELLVVLVIIAVLFAISSINLGQAQTTATVNSISNTLMADLKNQQILSMSGDKGEASSQQPHGVYIQNGSYTLFADSSYNSGNSNNYSVSVDPVTLSTTFPSNQVVFEVGDGAVSGFTSGNDTITITGNGQSQTITVNPLGALTLN